MMQQLQAPAKVFAHRHQGTQAPESRLATIFKNLRATLDDITNLREQLSVPANPDQACRYFQIKAGEINGQIGVLEKSLQTAVQNFEIKVSLSRNDSRNLVDLRKEINALMPVAHSISIDDRMPEDFKINLKSRLRGLTISLGQLLPSGMQPKPKQREKETISTPSQASLIHQVEEPGLKPLSSADLAEKLASLEKKLGRASEAVLEPKAYETSLLTSSQIRMNHPVKMAAVTLLAQLISDKTLFPKPSGREILQLLDIEQIFSALKSSQQLLKTISDGFRIHNAESKTLEFLKTDLGEAMLKLESISLPNLALTPTDHIRVDNKNSIWLSRSRDQARSFALKLPAELFKQLGFDSEQVKTNPTLVYQELQKLVNKTIEETRQPIQSLLQQVEKRELAIKQERELRAKIPKSTPITVSHDTKLSIVDQLPKIRRYLTEDESSSAPKLARNLKVWIHLAKTAGAEAADVIIERLREARRKFQETRKDCTNFATAIKAALLAKAEDQIHKTISSSITYVDKGIVKPIRNDNRLLQELAA